MGSCEVVVSEDMDVEEQEIEGEITGSKDGLTITIGAFDAGTSDAGKDVAGSSDAGKEDGQDIVIGELVVE